MAYDFPIAEVLEHYGSPGLHDHGDHWSKTLCVIHDERRPSARYSAGRGKFQCFVCDFYGDAVDLIQRMEGLDHQAAIDRATELTGTQGGALPRATAEPVRRTPARLLDAGTRVLTGNHQAIPAGRRRKPRRL